MESEVTDSSRCRTHPHLEIIVTSASTATDRVALDRAAWEYLARVANGPHPTLHALAAEHGPQYMANMIGSGLVPDEYVEVLASVIGEASRLNVSTQNRAEAAVNARIITRADSVWPERLSTLGDLEPFALWVRGPKIELLGAAPIAVAGSRAASSYGEHTSGMIASDLAERGVAVAVTSGFGVAGAATRAVLAAGGGIVVVSSVGIDRVHPVAQSALLTEVAERGLLVSEYAPGTVATRTRFNEHQRLVVALASKVVVVEAGLQSGTLGVVKWANRVGRPVGAVPGAVTSAASSGSNSLLVDGSARCVTSAEEILEMPEL